MTSFYSDMETLSKYSPIILHLSPPTGIFNENPELSTELVKLMQLTIKRFGKWHFESYLLSIILVDTTYTITTHLTTTTTAVFLNLKLQILFLALLGLKKFCH